MSEPPKKTRNRKQDVQLVVSCDAPKVGVAVAEGRSTSVYEIDIQGGYDLCRGERRECVNRDLKESSAKDPAKELRGACQENTQEAVEGHLEAHYPKVTETFSANQRPSFIVQRDILTDENKEKDRKPFTGKTNKKRQAMPTDARQKFRKQIKNYIIESFIGDKCGEMKSMVQNYQGALDGNEVHLHHHEHHHHHHHHYYSCDKALASETNPRTPVQKNGDSPEIVAETVTANANGTTAEHRHFEVESFQCSQAPVPAEETREERSDPLARENSEESDTLLLERGSLAFFNGVSRKNERISTSSLKSRTGETDMIFIKKPECSVDSVAMENTEIRGIKEEKSSSCKSYASVMENFKSLNHFSSPIVITDQKTVPKILYIRCDCSPWKGVGTPEEFETLQNKNSEGKHDLERKAEDGEDKKQPETEQSINSILNRCQGVENESSDELAFEVWTSRLKDELQEIKKELKRIEEKQALDKRSTNTSFRKEKFNEGGSDHKVTVYSSKTFIVQPPQDAAADV